MGKTPYAARFGGYTDIDGTVVFYARIRSLLGAHDTVLDVGCGRGQFQDDEVAMRRNLRDLRLAGAHVIGIDVDPEAAANPFMDEFHLLNGPRWPMVDETADLAYADCVLEHVDDPDAFFAEAQRVLKPGGILCLRTTNVLSYVGLFASLVPNRRHARVASAVQAKRKVEDVFPTRYRCNTVFRLRKALRTHGFEAVAYGYEAEPAYLSFSVVAYALGVVHQKFAPSLIKPALFAFARKPA